MTTLPLTFQFGRSLSGLIRPVRRWCSMARRSARDAQRRRGARCGTVDIAAMRRMW